MNLLFLIMTHHPPRSSFFFFNDTATTEIYTLSLHDALPISPASGRPIPSFSVRSARTAPRSPSAAPPSPDRTARRRQDRKSTRLNSSHGYISYAVFCLKKKKHNSQLTEPSTLDYQASHLLGI